MFFVLSAKVDISDVTVQGGAIPGTSGGGILNFGTLTLTNTTVSGNSAAAGAGITSDFFDVLTLTDSTVSGNTASQTGGGINNNGSAVTLTRSTVSGNTAGSNGGGIFNLQNFATLELTDSTVSGNKATNFDGGGIYITGFHTETVTNSTVSGNTAGRGGGGIYLQQGTLDLTNSTISGNTADSFAGGIFDNLSVGGVTLTNTIVANQLSGEDCVGTITSGGHNLDSDNTCGLGGTGDLSGGNADLDPLALNAPGTTETHALGTSSDAIDAGDDGAAPATDQRGSPRVGTSDIGAYEFQGTATPTPAPTATATAIPTTTIAPTGTPAPTATATPPTPTPTAVLGVTQLPATGGEPAGGSSALAWLALAMGMLIAVSGGLALAYQRRRVR